ncbi:MAG: OmpH family outer membrane protein [Rikenellaceae bacterium]
MKGIATSLAAIVLTISSLVAQNYMVVDSKAIFASVEEYTNAISTIDNLAKEYQAEVDKRFNSVESMYNTYMQRAASLNTIERGVYEAKIAEAEEAATAYQESIFSNGGELFKKRVEILKPIQERVFGVIEAYAKSNNFDLVLDEATNSTILYKSSSVERTEEVIKELKK